MATTEWLEAEAEAKPSTLNAVPLMAARCWVQKVPGSD